ncbi:probable cytochrome P450 6a14 [Zootermopsis nevadensis]|uniref:probable cytochrome P450 6a14 n=1 Tax=Zootermopsis nevadensis TaxID=136037 RepID=UPI000B8E9729|nr:probable cytochrome P450 6a14 [Zootermopsis nevadensis]
MGLIFGSLLLELGTLIASILSVIYIYFKWSFTYWKKRNVPYADPIFPFGNFTQSCLMRKQVGDVLTDIYKELEGHRYGGMYIFTKPSLILRDPDLIKDILVKDFSTFHDRGFYMNEEIEPLTGHLFMLPGKRWRNLRIKLTPTFTSGKLKMMFQRLVDCGGQLQHCVGGMTQNGDVIEIKDFLARFSTDVISSCAFGIDCNCLKNENAEFRQWGRKIFEPSLKQVILGILSGVAPVVLDTLKLSVIDSSISKYFRKMVEETVEYREKNNVKRNDFMELLIQLRNKGIVDPDQETDVQNCGTLNGNTETTEDLSMGSLAAQAFVFFIAGFETSSTTMTFCLYELSVNPDLQERLRAEIDDVLEKHDGNITYETILEMNYLDKVISETLRKYPPLPALMRECSKPYEIPGTDIVLDTGVRFGEGPRICIGMRFGLMQTKVGLVSLLSKYQFSVSQKTPIPLVFDAKAFILTPTGGMWLKIKNRSK